jgi:hypothetical protein
MYIAKNTLNIRRKRWIYNISFFENVSLLYRMSEILYLNQICVLVLLSVIVIRYTYTNRILIMSQQSKQIGRHVTRYNIKRNNIRQLIVEFSREHRTGRPTNYIHIRPIYHCMRYWMCQTNITRKSWIKGGISCIDVSKVILG